jgi:hypothetical protein
MRPDPAVESSRFGNQIPNISDRYKWGNPFRAHARGFLERANASRHDTGTRCPDRGAPSRVHSAISTVPAPVPTRAAPARAPTTCWRPGGCRRTQRRQCRTCAARAGAGAKGVGTRARQGCAWGNRARLGARRARARQCDGSWRVPPLLAAAHTADQIARERVLRARRKAHVHGECATRVHMLERELRPRCDARACVLCWRMGRGRRFAIY